MVIDTAQYLARKPIAASGEVERNFDCPYYSDCLDHAIAKKWSGWSCDDCDFREIESEPGTE